MTNDNRVQNEIEHRIKNSENNMPPMPDFVRPIFKDNFEKTHTIKQPEKKAQKSEHYNNGFEFLKKFNFKNIKFDNDVILIIILILILSAEESDKLLLFALIYIMI